MSQPTESDHRDQRSTALIDTTIPIVAGEFFVFFAEDAAQLPNENVARELKAAAFRYRDETRRDPQSFLDNAIATGVIGSAAWAATVRGFVAIRAYWQRLGTSHKPADAAAVLELVRRTCVSTLGKVPDRFDQVEIHQSADGNWRVKFAVDATTVTVRIDEYGRLLHWMQHRDQ